MVDVDHLHQLLTVPTLKWRTRRSEGPPQLTDNVAEVQAFAREENVHRGEPVTIQGRFESGTLFRAAYLPGQREELLRLTAIGGNGLGPYPTPATCDLNP